MTVQFSQTDIASLPTVLAGPILRRLTRSRVAVWMALSEDHEVELTVKDTTSSETHAVTATPHRIGAHLYVSVLDLLWPGEEGFAADRIYSYRVSSPGWSSGSGPDHASLGVGGFAEPSFLGPPAAVEGLRLFHASCRCPHGGRRDGLAYGDALLAGQSSERPHLMVLSGDQIYADHVATFLSARIKGISEHLIGVDEGLDLGGAIQSAPLAGRHQASIDMGFTVDAPYGRNHLWGFGEFCAMYLLAFSPALWPPDSEMGYSAALDRDMPGGAPPSFTDIGGVPADDANDVRFEQEEYEAEWLNLCAFYEDLPQVQRLLANVPTLMVFDDHEVTDDWNLGLDWVKQVYAADSRGRQVVANGLAAYALFQHWGNVPGSFATAGTPEASVLTKLTYATTPQASPGRDTALQALLGLPDAGVVATSDDPLTLRDPAGPNIRWDFRFGIGEDWPVDIVLLDERTCRRLHGDGGIGRVPAEALDAMWPGSAPGDTPDTLVILVASAPVLGLHAYEHLVLPAASLFPTGRLFVDNEPWTAHGPSFQHLLRRIAEHRHVVILSGDVHFAYTRALHYSYSNEDDPSHDVEGRAVQFVSSAAKNTSGKTVALHLAGQAMNDLGIIRERNFVGFESLTTNQQNRFLQPPSGAMLVYDDLVDIALARTARAVREDKPTIPREVAEAYSFTESDWDWSYTITPVSDTRTRVSDEPSDTHPHAAAIASAVGQAGAGALKGWDADASAAMVKGLRSRDLLRLGREIAGLPNLALIRFVDSHTVEQTLYLSFGSDLGDPQAPRPVSTAVTTVDIGPSP